MQKRPMGICPGYGNWKNCTCIPIIVGQVTKDEENRVRKEMVVDSLLKKLKHSMFYKLKTIPYTSKYPLRRCFKHVLGQQVFGSLGINQR